MRTMREVELEWELHQAYRRIAELEGNLKWPLTWEDTDLKTTIVDTRDLPMVARVHSLSDNHGLRVRLETIGQPRDIQLGYYITKEAIYTMHHLEHMLITMHEDLMDKLMKEMKEKRL